MKSEEDLFDTIGDPVTAAYTNTEIPWSPELPKHLVQYTVWPGWYEASDEDLRLLDLGLAFPVGNTVTGIAQPWDLRSPETFFIGSFDYRHDLWRAGCVVGIFSAYSNYLTRSFHDIPPPGLTVRSQIYSLYYQKRPFISFGGKDVWFIRKLVTKLGPLPDNWQNRWEDIQRQSQYAQNDGEFLTG